MSRFKNDHWRSLKSMHRIAHCLVVLVLGTAVTAMPGKAQEGEITGTVVQSKDEEPLPSVNVRIQKQSLGAVTDEKGRFRISKVPEGTHVVKASLVGYSTATKNVRVHPGETTSLNIRLSQKSVELSGITVTEETENYVPEEVTSVTKIGAPISETPQSVSVVTSDQLAVRSVDRLSESLRYTPGVQGETFGFDPRTFFLRFRGFDATRAGLYRNGLQFRSPTTSPIGYDPEPYAAERIEVPRGPSSVLYGAGSLGGLVNFVTKRPQRAPYQEVIAEYGTDNHWQGKVDVTGPIDDDGTFSYRLTGVARKADTQIDHVPNDRIFVAPALSWRPSDATTLTVLGRYQQDNTGAPQPLPVSGTIEPNPNGEVPPRRFLGEPDVDRYDRTQWSVEGLFSHDFSGAFSINQKTRYYSVDVEETRVIGGTLQSDQRTITRSLSERLGHLDGISTDTQVQRDLATGPIEHTFLAGLDIQWIRTTSTQNAGRAPSVDLFDPTYGVDVSVSQNGPDLTTTQRQIGVYLQDRLRLYENWIVMLNGRVDWVRTEVDVSSTSRTFDQNDRALTGRAGLVYESSIGLNPYASYSQSFLPLLGTGPNDEPFDPERGEQWEIGAKYQPPGTNSFVTIALFDLTRKNTPLQGSAVPPEPNQAGAANSQGVEVEAVASPVAGLDIEVNGTLQDVEITESSRSSREGERPVSAREKMGSVWVDYTIQKAIVRAGF